jgi:CelD/BcsL family acetyltransferase involved in cellulose biosynthesis
MADGLECRFLETAAEISALRADWEGLLRTARCSDLLLGFQWYDAWRRVFGLGIRNGVVTIRRGGNLVGLMPIMIGRVLRSPSMEVRHDYLPGDDKFLTTRPRFRLIPVRQLSPILGLEATTWRGGPLAAPGEEILACQALLHFLRDFAVWDVAVFPLPASLATTLESACRTFGIKARIHRLNRPMYRRIDLPPWATFLKSKQRHFRKRQEEAVKRATKLGLTFETLAGPQDIARGLALISEVAERSWKAVGREGQALHVPYTPASRSFFEALCSGADAAVVPVVSVIYEASTPRAALMSVAFGARLFTLLTFYDPSIKHVSLGRVLIKMVYEWAVDHGIAEIDFNSNNPFAATYADHRDIYDNLTLFSGSIYGRLLHALSRHRADSETSTTPDETSESCQDVNP